MNDPTVQRVRRWYDALPEETRPHWEDIEVVVRLGVTTTAAAQRLLWNNPEALAQRFDALQAVIRPQESAVDSSGSTAQAGEPALPQAPSTSAHAPSGGTDTLLKQARVLAWLETLRLEGIKVDLSPDIVEQVSTASSLAQLRGLLPRELVRRRGDELAMILGIGRQGPDRQSPIPGNKREGGRGAPAPVPVPSEGRHDSEAAAPSGLASADGFAPFTNWSSAAQTDVRFSASAGEGIGLSWEAPVDGERVHIYRVTARDDYEPASPDESRLIAVTYDSAATDTAVFTTAKRHVAVWRHRGADDRLARASQADLWAAGTCVLPARNIRITVVDGQVAGTWTVADGVDHVEILRMPEADAVTDNYNLRYRISGEEPKANLFGFEDHPGPGNWVYRIYACASHNDRPLRSPMIERTVTVAAILPRVTDLQVTSAPGDPDLYTLSWTKPVLPNAWVEIYRHREPLQAGIESRVLDRDAMNRYGLTEDTLVNQQAIEREGRMVMERVPWPAGVPRIHFTAVTKSGDGRQFQIGDTETRNRAGELTHARLVERVDEQFVTFSWPQGADFVQVYQGARHAQVDDVSALACVVDLSQQKYERLGGAHLPHPLPSSGCSIHLVGVSYQEGRPSRGPVCSIDYPGLARIQYSLERHHPPEPVKRGLFGRKSSVPPGPVPPSLSVRSDRDLDELMLALVHHRTRLPLYPGDGEKILEGPVSLRADQKVTLKAQLPELLDRGGFVRLFVIVPEAASEQFAVLDPPVQQLRCD